MIPIIPGEEEKVARETGKILGRVVDGAVAPASFPVSATCTRAGTHSSVSTGTSHGQRTKKTPSTPAPTTPATAAEA